MKYIRVMYLESLLLTLVAIFIFCVYLQMHSIILTLLTIPVPLYFLACASKGLLLWFDRVRKRTSTAEVHVRSWQTGKSMECRSKFHYSLVRFDSRDLKRQYVLFTEVWSGELHGNDYVRIRFYPTARVICSLERIDK